MPHSTGVSLQLAYPVIQCDYLLQHAQMYSQVLRRSHHMHCHAFAKPWQAADPSIVINLRHAARLGSMDHPIPSKLNPRALIHCIQVVDLRLHICSAVRATPAAAAAANLRGCPMHGHGVGGGWSALVSSLASLQGKGQGKARFTGHEARWSAGRWRALVRSLACLQRQREGRVTGIGARWSAGSWQRMLEHTPVQADVEYSNAQLVH